MFMLASAVIVRCRLLPQEQKQPTSATTFVLRSNTRPPYLPLLLHLFAPHVLNRSNKPSPFPYPRPSPNVPRPSFSRHRSPLCTRIVHSDIFRDRLIYRTPSIVVRKITYISVANLLFCPRARKHFLAVTYEHGLRNSQSDVHQLRACVGSPFHSGELSSPAVTAPGSRDTGDLTPGAYTDWIASRDTGSPSNEASIE
jgi:hypothetical protein